MSNRVLDSTTETLLEMEIGHKEPESEMLHPEHEPSLRRSIWKSRPDSLSRPKCVSKGCGHRSPFAGEV